MKSDFPAGYGGSNPTFRHDIRFKNSELYKVQLRLHAYVGLHTSWGVVTGDTQISHDTLGNRQNP